MGAFSSDYCSVVLIVETNIKVNLFLFSITIKHYILFSVVY